MNAVGTDTENIGQEMYELIRRLYPICRSITGDGVRQTLDIIRQYVPVEIHEVPSGTQVFDWTVPKEWNIREAYVKTSTGEKIIDFAQSNLHVLNYSVPVKGTFTLDELKPHLFTLPDHPKWIPYLTSYYQENWGFCLTHEQYEQLAEDVYTVLIDSSLEDGALTWGELYLKGIIEDEIMLSCYVCHPSLCNDNLSGTALVTLMAKYLQSTEHRYSYRFLFIPETIGAITWLCLNEKTVSKIRHGLVATCVGDLGRFTYKRSRQGNTVVDRAAEKVLAEWASDYTIVDFFPTGSDERQFCSPGFNLPVGSLMRTPYNLFPEYHTSADNLDLVGAKYLGESFELYRSIMFVLENNRTYINLCPKCEPQLGRRGLYAVIGSQKTNTADTSAMLWVLNLSDGLHSLLDIAIRSNMPFEQINVAAHALQAKGLLKLDPS